MSYEIRLVESDCGRREFLDKIGRDADAEIAALKQRVAELERERDAARKTREFQSRVKVWMLTCLGPEVAADSRERNYRFLEEALELVQACGCTREDAVKLVDYVFARPIGVVSQEVGGVMVSLAALCSTRGEDFVSAAEAELSRISTPEMVQKIRAKHASKTIRGPLPGELAAYRATKEPRDEKAE